jgi:hypothetical protein
MAEQSKQHTPGPWTVYPDPAQGFVADEIRGPAGRFAIIAKLTPTTNREANAKLLAASHALLEALQFMVAWAKPLPGPDSPAEVQACAAIEAAS